jgi:peptide/nickel transport system substrate-binding protein
LKIRRLTRNGLIAVALAGSAAVALAGCTTTGGAPSSAPTATVTIAQVNEVTSFNYNTAQGNLDSNGMVNYMTQPQFFTLDEKFNIVPNKDLGTYEKLSDNPLTVKYTLASGAKWSDGKDMTANDLMLGWAISSCYYDDAKFGADGAVTTGTQYFATAGGCVFSTNLATVGDNNKSITFTYDTPYVDWQLVNPIQFPASVIAKKAGVTEDALMTVFNSTPKGNPATPAAPQATLAAAAAFVNTGYDATALPTDPDLLISGGPLMVSAWTPAQSMTFVPNPQYKGTHAAKFGQLVMRFIGDANAQVTALQNGEVDAIQPQASADTVKAINAATGTTALQGSQVAYDHLDLNFGSSVFSDPKIRKAFLLTVPRADILAAIVTPVNPDAKVLDSEVFLPGQDGYDKSIAANGSSAYSKVDIAQAKTLLAGATPTVKILYNTKNPNRVDAFQAIQASAAKAGFNVVDGGSPQWSKLLAGGDYDASIFGWINPGAGNAALPQLFQLGNPSNYNRYNDQAISDLAVKTQTTLDTAELLKQKLAIDAGAFGDAYGLPLFQSPGLFATNASIKGVKYFGGQTGLVWNFWDWTK